jgi:LysM repeat protein
MISADGLPGTALVRAVMLTLGVGFVVGLFFVVSPVTLPNERERTSAAPRATETVRPPAAGTAQPAATAAQAPAPTAAAGTPGATVVQRHTIQPGDTLLRIAERYDTTVDAIRAANPGLAETALRVGAEIVIPASP